MPSVPGMKNDPPGKTDQKSVALRMPLIINALTAPSLFAYTYARNVPSVQGKQYKDMPV